MFTISVETNFSAQHSVILPDGRREKLHRHDWRVVAEVGREELDEGGFVMDFDLLRSAVKKITSEFEGRVLDELEYFRHNGSSAEIVAKYIYELLAQRLSERVKLEGVRVYEAAGCSARYSK